ncbi:hypothetical protein FRB99_008366 [Tulasnella sp. 403]|nr:hypothetical protein FRB99_008366 [Tulasnella sp. 403]
MNTSALSTRKNTGWVSNDKPLRTNVVRRGDLANRAPDGAIERWIWAKRLRFESTFAMSMLEPWEKVLGLSVLILLWSLLIFSGYYYLPPHIRFVLRRAKYYLLGEDATGSAFIVGQAVGEL